MIPVEEFLREYERRPQSSAATRPSCDPAQQRAAMRYAAIHGWRIFPVPQASSLHASMTRDRIGEATNDLAALEELADLNSGCRWALATGQASGVFVLEMEGGLGSAALGRLTTIYMDDGSDFQTLSSRAGESVFAFFRFPAGLAMRHGYRHFEPGLAIHGDGDFVLLPPSRYSSGIVHDYLNPDTLVAVVPPWLLDLAFEAVREDSELLVPRIPPHRAGPEFLPGIATPSAKAESQNSGQKRGLTFGQANWRKKLHFPRRA
jgi:hypothetical protein